MNKSDAVREVLAELGQDAPAANVAAIVLGRYGVNVSAAYVRVCRSRDTREAGIYRSSRVARTKPAPVTVPVPRPRAPVRPARRADEADQADRDMYALLDSVLAAVESALEGQPRQVTGDQEFIHNIQSILNDPEIRDDNPGYEYSTRVRDDGMITLTIRNQDEGYSLPPPKYKRSRAY